MYRFEYLAKDFYRVTCWQINLLSKKIKYRYFSSKIVKTNNITSVSPKNEPTEHSLFYKFCAMMKTVFSCLFITLFIQFACGQNRNDQDWAVLKYIDKYKQTAIEEMRRAGVPASIKMAQAILESNSGRSDLAKKANNHFGMKCGGYWDGKTYYKEDDDIDENGKLIKSCFRKYKKGIQSFYAHTEFLQKPRYRFLFSNLDARDYESWAHGLKSAGYATNPAYASGLIRLIEKYELFKLDETAINGDDRQPSANDRPLSVTGGTIARNNDLRVVYASQGMTANDIVVKHKTKLKCLLKYNEQLNSGTRKLKEGEKVYLQKKRRNWRGKEKYHEVEEGESMYSIAQKYGLRLDKFYKKNRMPAGMEPEVGEKVKIRGIKVKAELVPRYSKRVIEEEEEDNNTNTTIENPEETEEEFLFDDDIVEVYHLVKKGDTLYNIALRYDITVKTLKRWNKLEVDTISIGQRLRVK